MAGALLAIGKIFKRDKPPAVIEEPEEEDVKAQPVPDDKAIMDAEQKKIRKLYSGRGRKGSILSGGQRDDKYG